MRRSRASSTCTDAVHPPRYEPTTVKVYNDRRFARGAGPREPDPENGSSPLPRRDAAASADVHPGPA